MYEQFLWSFGQLPDEYIVIDTETTGLFDGTDAPDLVSIGVALIERNEVIDKDEYLIKPSRSFTDNADSIHGFSWEESQQHPELSENWAKISEHLKNKLIIVHNALFDWRVITAASERADLTLPEVSGVFCSQRAAQPWAMANGIQCSERGPSLDALAQFLEIPNSRGRKGGIHRSDIDAELTGLVVESLRQRFTGIS